MFTQVGLETLQWAQESAVPTVLESPNGHIRNFRCVYENKCKAGVPGLRGHPSPEMVERVEQEYALADRVRVSSRWSKASLVECGVDAQKMRFSSNP